MSSKTLINVIKNPSHRLIVELFYSAGLRVSEVVNLKVCDLEFGHYMGWVRKGKGNKDRPFIIAECLIHKLKEYVNDKAGYVFPGRHGHLSVRSVQEIERQATKKPGINKNVHPHSLRHSFATPLIENGNDVVTVQPLLGHNNAETTNIYIHMARPVMIKIKSPLDEYRSIHRENSKDY